ncbi:hypothetical protein [Microbacterium sp. XT11]|uniref:hypothetical protein n=1 Tax=Microbacterium sp. XT11 TaxID=367477 RepID=UPI000A62C54E|nr:hypothetical protein [Microbacterium sp. XT11]
MRAEIGNVRAETESLRTEIRAEFSALGRRLDRLDADISALTKRAFGLERD